MRVRIRHVVATAIALSGCAALIDLRDDYVLGTPDGNVSPDGATDGEIPISCTNGRLDDTESDIDCGGICPKCGEGRKCQIAADCESSVCTGGICQPPRCDDGVKNGTEGDKDCGGTCPNRCPLGSTCGADNDCLGAESDAGLAGDANVVGAQYNVPLSACERGQCTTYAAIGVWEDRGPAVGMPRPPVTQGSRYAYDPVRKRVVSHGGAAPVTGTPADVTYLWDGTSWTQAAGAQPGSRISGDAVWYPPRNVVVFGSGNEMLLTPSTSTVTWNGLAWADAGSAPAVPRQHGAMVYDPLRQRVWLYGGQEPAGTGSYYGDMYGWDGTAWASVPVGANNPGLRAFFDMAFDEKRGVTVLFGGFKTVGMMNIYSAETWLWDGTAWTLANAPRSPTGRFGASMVWDPIRERVVIIGGFPLSDSYGRREVHEWNGTTWIPSKSIIEDGQTEANHAVYDLERKRVVLVAADGQKVYEYSLRGNACKNASECAGGACVDGVCCTQPSCNACQSCNQLSNPGVCTPVVNAPDDSCPAPKKCNASSVCE